MIVGGRQLFHVNLLKPHSPRLSTAVGEAKPVAPVVDIEGTFLVTTGMSEYMCTPDDDRVDLRSLSF